MKIVYLHGRMSSPNSYKSQVLEHAGHEVFAPALRSTDWEQSVNAANNMIADVEPDLVIGSSRGGAVAMATNTMVPTILICPAWGKYCPWGAARGSTVILHAKSDRIVPISDSKLLSKTFGCELIEIGKDHRMNDDDAIDTLLNLVKKYEG